MILYLFRYYGDFIIVGACYIYIRISKDRDLGHEESIRRPLTQNYEQTLPLTTGSLLYLR